MILSLTESRKWSNLGASSSSNGLRLLLSRRTERESWSERIDERGVREIPTPRGVSWDRVAMLVAQSERKGKNKRNWSETDETEMSNLNFLELSYHAPAWNEERTPMEPTTPPAGATPTLTPTPTRLEERTFSDATIAPAARSPAATTTAQAALGRGAPPPAAPTTPRSVSASFTTAHPPTAHPSASLAPPSSTTPHAHAVSETTDNASLLSEEGELSDNYYDGYYADRDRDKAARGATHSSGNYSATTNARANKGKKVNLPRGGATAARGKGRGRTATGTKQDDADEDDEEEPALRDRAMSPGLSLLSMGRTTTFDEDDEVERRDRGEELVRKRMRDRARIKKVRFTFFRTFVQRLTGFE